MTSSRRSTPRPGPVLEHLAELEPRVQLLAGDDRDADLAPTLGERAEVARRDRFLVPEGIEGLEHPRDAYRVHGRQSPVHLDEQVDAGTDGVAHGADRFDHLAL